METSFPYALVSCPCDPEDEPAAAGTHGRRTTLPPSHESDHENDEDDKQHETLDPHDPRTEFSLYPYNRLLYCDECHQIRCPKCWAEEVTHWYCPSCLFEVPSSVVKNDGNRCTRSCYNCPGCTTPLSIHSLEQQDASAPASNYASTSVSGPFFLSCSYCEWSSLDIGIELSKPTKITEQLVRLRKNYHPPFQRTMLSKEVERLYGDEAGNEQMAAVVPSSEQRYARLIAFYKDQISTSETGISSPLGFDASYSSPSSLGRIMQIYAGVSAPWLKKAKEKPNIMREALSAEEGLTTFFPSAPTVEAPFILPTSRSQMATYEQRSSHPWNHNARLVTDLWPVPALLKTKTSKRCRTCRHILIRHDDSRSSKTASGAISSGRYKIRLLAQNRIPRLSLRPFDGRNLTSATNPFPRAAFALTPTELQAIRAGTEESGVGATLHPLQTRQFLLLVVNPLFETVHITLATPQTTPGKVESRVTILCPSFEVGADGDMWDSALDGGGGGGSTALPGRLGGDTSSGAGGVRKEKAGLAGGPGQFKGNVGGGSNARMVAGSEETDQMVPEAGKVWERGRNWVAVVVEVVPGALPPSSLGKKEQDQKGDRTWSAEGHQGGMADEDGEDYDEWVLRERQRRASRSLREDVLEIPVFVKAEWEAEGTGEEADGGGDTATTTAAAAAAAADTTSARSPTKTGGKVKREIGFWCVLGAGRIVP